MKERIMIVDDEPLITKTLETFLKFSFDGEVFATNDPIEAVELAKQIEPDMIITDFMMPGLNGLELLKKTREIIPNAITILLTGYADKENAIRCINEVGLYYYAEKPWDNAALLKIIENGLEKHRLENALAKKLRELEESHNEISRLYGLLKRDFDEEVDNLQNLMITLANLIESKDTYTDGHTRRVGQLCRMLGERFDLDPGRLRAIEMAGIIHDIGKVGVSEAILNKNGPLTPEEFNEMKKHTILGHHICLPLNILKHCLDPIRHHHEKLDGSGYPDGLKGAQISIDARIVAVADIFDALATDRPYRRRLPFAEIKRILTDEVDIGHLDGNVVATVLEFFEAGKLEEFHYVG